MPAPSILGAAAFTITANVDAFTKGLEAAGMAVRHFERTTTAALLRIAVRAGSDLDIGLRNVEQVFGRSTRLIVDGADRQAGAFGQARDEYLSYAAEIGYGLRKLSVDEDVATNQTLRLLDAAQRLGQQKGIGLGEAVGRIEARGALFSEAEVRGEAFLKGLMVRNQLLDEGVALLIRNDLAIKAIDGSTAAVTGRMMTFSSEISSLWGNLKNLAATIGTILAPAFNGLLELLNQIIYDLDLFLKGIISISSEVARLLGLTGGGAAGSISARNDREAAESRRRRFVGEAFGAGGGMGGFQGGLAEFSRHIQAAAFQPRQISLLDRQLKVQQQIERNTSPRAAQGARRLPVGGAVPVVWHDH